MHIEKTFYVQLLLLLCLPTVYSLPTRFHELGNEESNPELLSKWVKDFLFWQAGPATSGGSSCYYHCMLTRPYDNLHERCRVVGFAVGNICKCHCIIWKINLPLILVVIFPNIFCSTLLKLIMAMYWA